LSRSRYGPDQDVSQKLALATRPRPDFRRDPRRLLIERKDDAVRDQRLESAHLPVKRLSGADRELISP
jgi:hypothetical protein